MNQINSSSLNQENESKQKFSGRGKLLLTGEYLVLDGAKALAIPTNVGQSLEIEYSQSYEPTLTWESYDVNGEKWFQGEYEFWHFDILTENPSEEHLFLQKILKQARIQNKHFLRDNQNIKVTTKLEFPLNWGLGSSSTLVYNIAQWAYISPFEMLFNTLGGSGYDIACAQSDGPIVYEKSSTGPHWATADFNPSFASSLYFVYLGKKQNSRDAINYFKAQRPYDSKLISEVNDITDGVINCRDLETFERLIERHEDLLSGALNLQKVKDLHFADYWGAVKSLGAWGGDFVLVSSSKSELETQSYFSDKGFDICLPFSGLVLTQRPSSSDETIH